MCQFQIQLPCRSQPFPVMAPRAPQEVGSGEGGACSAQGRCMILFHSISYKTDPFLSTVPNYYHSQESLTAGSSHDCEDRMCKGTLFKSCRPPDRHWQTSPPRETLAVQGYMHVYTSLLHPSLSQLSALHPSIPQLSAIILPSLPQQHRWWYSLLHALLLRQGAGNTGAQI